MAIWQPAVQKEEDGLSEQQNEYRARNLKANDIISKLMTINFMMNKNKHCADEAKLTTLSFHVHGKEENPGHAVMALAMQHQEKHK